MRHMKLYSELTPLQKFIRQSITRFIIYGGFALILCWSANELIEIKQQREAEAKGQVMKQTIRHH